MLYKWTKKYLQFISGDWKKITALNNKEKAFNLSAIRLIRLHAVKLLMKAVYDGGMKQDSTDSISHSMLTVRVQL